MSNLINSKPVAARTAVVAICTCFALCPLAPASEASPFREEHQVRNLWRVHAPEVLKGHATLVAELEASKSPQLGRARAVTVSIQQFEQALHDLEKYPTGAHWRTIRARLQRYCTNLRKFLIPERIRFASAVEFITVGTHDLRFAQDLVQLFPRLPELRNCKLIQAGEYEAATPDDWKALNTFRVHWQSYSTSLAAGIADLRQRWAGQQDTAQWRALLDRLQARRSQVDLSLNEFMRWPERGTRPRLLVAIIELCAMADEMELAAMGFASTKFPMSIYWLLILTKNTGQDLRDANLTTRCRRDPFRGNQSEAHWPPLSKRHLRSE